MSNEPDLRIFVDRRETRATNEVYENLVFFQSTVARFENFLIVKKQLPVADLLFGDLAGERKTIKDLIQSIHNARVFEQAFNMAQNYRYVYILISGSLEDVPDNSKRKAILMSIADIELRYNIRVRFCMNEEMLAYYWLGLCYKLAKNVKPKWHVRRATPTNKDNQLMVVTGIKDVGPKTAKKLLLHFGSIRKLFNATMSELLAVHGIGDKLAKLIYNIAIRKYEPKKKTSRRRQ